MKLKLTIIFILLITFFLPACTFPAGHKEETKIICGDQRMDLYLPLLRTKRIAVVANQTAMIGKTHLVDTLLSQNINVVKIFSPEHGFRGLADAGEKFENSTDVETGLPIISLYGKNYKPRSEDLEGLDIVLFDIQDVGVRFYTYISTMTWVMEACAENNITLLILDRPNPNGFYVDGPLLEDNYRSFVGLHTVPLVYGMTIAEYARMLNGEGWLNDGVRCDLKYIACKNYTHDSLYKLEVSPSPNLPDMRAVYLYPSLGLFEGTSISVGRGTHYPFQVFGSPYLESVDFSFTPQSIPGASVNPPYKGELCYGVDLRKVPIDSLVKKHAISLQYLLFAYQHDKQKVNFFNSYFENLVGTATLRRQVEEGLSEGTIRNDWQQGLEWFMTIRGKYLIYPDFKK
ncbi:MAG TPA: DUF1343 domain-containing protein [Bacteroidales bacterium]|nr:DUF1343 domain-containing protein [Bacteroidales bacterium]